MKADTLLGKAVSDEDGKAVFESDLPFGSYYIKELAGHSSIKTTEIYLHNFRQDLNNFVSGFKY